MARTVAFISLQKKNRRIRILKKRENSNEMKTSVSLFFCFKEVNRFLFLKQVHNMHLDIYYIVFINVELFEWLSVATIQTKINRSDYYVQHQTSRTPLAPQGIKTLGTVLKLNTYFTRNRIPNTKSDVIAHPFFRHWERVNW